MNQYKNIFVVLILLFIIPAILASIGSHHTASDVWIKVPTQNGTEEMNLAQAFLQNLQSTAGQVDCGAGMCLQGFDSEKSCVQAHLSSSPMILGEPYFDGFSSCGSRCRVYEILQEELASESESGGDIADSTYTLDSNVSGSNESEKFFKELIWTRTDFKASNARVTKKMSSATFSGANHINYETDNLRGWRNKGEAYGFAAIAVLRDGKWYGAQYEHVRNRESQIRSKTNIRGGYHDIKPVPQSGETVRTWFYSYDLDQATNYIEFTYVD